MEHSNTVFGAGFLVGFFAALLAVIIAKALNAGIDRSAENRFEKLNKMLDLDVPDQDVPVGTFVLRAANIDASRLAGALEAGLRSGWPFNTLVTRALHEHYERVGRRRFERNARLN